MAHPLREVAVPAGWENPVKGSTGDPRRERWAGSWACSTGTAADCPRSTSPHRRAGRRRGSRGAGRDKEHSGRPPLGAPGAPSQPVPPARERPPRAGGGGPGRPGLCEGQCFPPCAPAADGPAARIP